MILARTPQCYRILEQILPFPATKATEDHLLKRKWQMKLNIQKVENLNRIIDQYFEELQMIFQRKIFQQFWFRMPRLLIIQGMLQRQMFNISFHSFHCQLILDTRINFCMCAIIRLAK
jgi:hypothetical protein